MQKLKLGILVFGMVVAMGCSKDDDNNTHCVTAPPPVENIIGSWTVHFNDDGTLSMGSAAFKNDGTFTTTPADLLVGSSSTTTVKTYKVMDNQIELIAVDSSIGSKEELSYPITENTCTKMVIHASIFNSTITMTR